MFEIDLLDKRNPGIIGVGGGGSKAGGVASSGLTGEIDARGNGETGILARGSTVKNGRQQDEEVTSTHVVERGTVVGNGRAPDDEKSDSIVIGS
jgi:hypothetical protein